MPRISQESFIRSAQWTTNKICKQAKHPLDAGKIWLDKYMDINHKMYHKNDSKQLQARDKPQTW